MLSSNICVIHLNILQAWFNLNIQINAVIINSSLSIIWQMEIQNKEHINSYPTQHVILNNIYKL